MSKLRKKDRKLIWELYMATNEQRDHTLYGYLENLGRVFGKTWTKAQIIDTLDNH